VWHETPPWKQKRERRGANEQIQCRPTLSRNEGHNCPQSDEIGHPKLSSRKFSGRVKRLHGKTTNGLPEHVKNMFNYWS